MQEVSAMPTLRDATRRQAASARMRPGGASPRRPGALDRPAQARITAELIAIGKRRLNKLYHRAALASDGRWLATARPAPPRVLAVALPALFLLAAGGLASEHVLGGHFMPAFTDEYDAAPSLWLVLALLFAVAGVQIDRGFGLVLGPAPWRPSRRLPVIVALAAALAGLTAAAPAGWAALAVRLTGSSPGPMWATVLSIQPPEATQPGCRIDVALQVRGITSDMCLDGRFSGPLPAAGSRVRVTGQVSVLGICVERVQAE
jgi:hypothetical protein